MKNQMYFSINFIAAPFSEVYYMSFNIDTHISNLIIINTTTN